MDTVIIAAAKYLIYVMVVGFGLVWLLAEKRRGKVELALAAIVGLAIALVLIKLASTSYWHTRPFLSLAEGGDGSIALLDHAPDNGFPSDHSVAAGLMSALIVLRRHWVAGAASVLAAVGVAWGRVAASVHHLLDVAVGLGLGAIGAALGVAGMTVIVQRTPVLTAGPLGRWVTAGEPVTARHRG